MPSARPRRFRPSVAAAMLALCAAGLALPDGAAAANTPAPLLAGPLHVQGNRIVDAHWHTVVLRGLNRIGPQQTYDSSSFQVTKQEIDGMRSWGANVVRIPVNEAKWTNYCPRLHQDGYAAFIDSIVNWVNQDGMLALIDLHATSGSQCGPPAVGRQAPDKGSVIFWREAAAHYANWALVAFELFNEPHLDRGSPAWLNGDSQYVTETHQTAPNKSVRNTYRPLGEQQLYDAVEGTGARNLIMIDADHFSSLPTAITTGYAVNDYHHNIIYAVHPYQCTYESPSSCLSDPSKQQANKLVLNRFQAVAATYPVFASEFGWPSNTAAGATYLSNTFAYLDGQSPAWGSAVFAWDGGTSGAFDTLSSLGPTWTPDTTGQVVRNELRTRH